MYHTRNHALMICEAAAVLLLTAAAFLWGLTAGRIQRGCSAIGGEYLLLLIPAIYYAGKRTVLDWTADIQEMRNAPRGGRSDSERDLQK